MGCLKVRSSLCSDRLSVECSTQLSLRVQCFIVCELSSVVKVSKEYVFLTPYNLFHEDIDVISNITWEAVINN